MTKEPRPLPDPDRVFCEVCGKLLAPSAAIAIEAKDYVAYFCTPACRARWRGEPAPAASPHEPLHEGRSRSKARDDLDKKALRREPQRNLPRVEGFDPDEVPGPQRRK
ncbi:MAG: hypothetical protein N2653_00760 [Burkholderiales bacterium]|nr:hypothetical protein [Burkholderiales bacterium]